MRNRIDHRHSPVHPLLLLAAVACFVTGPATAAEWRLQPLLSVGYAYDDNAVLASTDAEIVKIQGSVVEAAATLGYTTERTTFDFQPRFLWNRYDESIYDSDDQFAGLNFEHKGLRSNLEFHGSYSKEAARKSERGQAAPGVVDPGQVPDDDTGSIVPVGDRERFWISPRWSYNVTEKTAIAAGISYSDVSYDIPVQTLVAFTDASFDASLRRKFSEKATGYIKGSTRRFERAVDSSGNSRDVDTSAFSIGLDHSVTELTRIRAEIGVEQTRPNTGDKKSAFVADFHIVKDLETLKLLAQYKRSVSASGDGFLVPRDSVTFSMTKQFSERVTGGLAARAYSTSRSDLDPNAGNERDYVQAVADLSIALTRVLSMQAEYRHTYIDRTTIAGGAADSNEFGLNFIYQPNPLTTSR